MPRDPRAPQSVSDLTLARAVRRGEARALGEGEVKSAALKIPATDGTPLAASFYAPTLDERDSSGTVVLASATGVKRHFYDPFARYLAEYGFRVVTFDYRGIGGSRPESLRGFRATAREWGERDLEGVLAWTAERFRGDRLLAVAHSIGGQLLGFAPSSERLERVLLVGAQNGYWGHFGAPWRWLFGLAMHVAIPGTTRAFGYFPGGRFGLGEDLPAGVAAEWAAWCRDPEYFFGARHGVDREGFARLRAQVLALGISDDAMAPERAMRAILDAYPNARIERRQLRPADAGLDEIGHFGFFRRPARTRLWPDAADWLAGG